VDTSNDNSNCGECENVCLDTQTCVDGVCHDEPCYPAEEVESSISVPETGGCYRTETSFSHLGCWNFEGFTVLINGEEFVCDESQPTVTLPPAYNGYWYIEIVGTGTQPGASMSWW
jgi:hypothetical protein